MAVAHRAEFERELIFGNYQRARIFAVMNGLGGGGSHFVVVLPES